MKKIAFLLSVAILGATFLLHTSLGFAQVPPSPAPSVHMYPASPDTQWVLPGEYWFYQCAIETDDANDKLLFVNAYTDLTQVRFYSSVFYLDWNEYFRAQDSLSTWRAEWLVGNLFHLRWLPNYSWVSQNFLWLYFIEATIKIPEGTAIRFNGSISGALLTPSLDYQIFGVNFQKTLIGIDGTRGNVDRDSEIGKKDVERMMEYFDRHNNLLDYTGRYTATGVNYGLGAILFPYPDEISLALLNLWIYNHDEPLVQGLGIGELFSKPTQVEPAPAEFTQNGNTLSVSSSGDVVNVCGIIEGQRWQKTFFTNETNNIDLPVGIANLKVDAVKLPGNTVTGIKQMFERDKCCVCPPREFELQQNYPNPFNATTTIRYSLPSKQAVTLTVYNLLGREVAKLVDEEKDAGDYQISFDGSNLASGTYIYKLSAGHVQAKKMVLLK